MGQALQSKDYTEKDEWKFQTPLKKSSSKHILLNGLPRNYFKVRIQRFSLPTSTLEVAGFMSIMLKLRLGVAAKAQTHLKQ